MLSCIKYELHNAHIAQVEQEVLAILSWEGICASYQMLSYTNHPELQKFQQWCPRYHLSYCMLHTAAAAEHFW